MDAVYPEAEGSNDKDFFGVGLLIGRGRTGYPTPPLCGSRIDGGISLGQVRAHDNINKVYPEPEANWHHRERDLV